MQDIHGSEWFTLPVQVLAGTQPVREAGDPFSLLAVVAEKLSREAKRTEYAGLAPRCQRCWFAHQARYG